MIALQTLLDDSQRRDIHLIANYIDRHIQHDWEQALHDTQARMVELFPEIGDSAYATYNKRLFQSVHKQLNQAGFKANPPLPGDLMTSREWGHSERERQRWMWSEIITTNGDPLGTIVVVVFHDHKRIRIPRAFQVIALQETGLDAVVERLSLLSADFKNAPDMKTEVAQYMADNPLEDG